MKAKSLMLLPLILTVFCGCSPAKRLERLIGQHPELTVADMIRLSDTIITSGAIADTGLLFTNLTDTVVIRNDNLVMQVFRDSDTLYLAGECKPETIYWIKVIPVEKIRIVKPVRGDALIAKIPWLVTGILGLAAGIILVLYRFRSRRQSLMR